MIAIHLKINQFQAFYVIVFVQKYYFGQGKNLQIKILVHTAYKNYRTLKNKLQTVFKNRDVYFCLI